MFHPIFQLVKSVFAKENLWLRWMKFLLPSGEKEDMAAFLAGMEADQWAGIDVFDQIDIMQRPISDLVAALHEHSVSRVLFAAQHVHFSKIEEAVQAVDFEVHRMGRAAESSARAEASWRRAAAPKGRAEAVAGVRRGGRAATALGDVLALEAWVKVTTGAKRAGPVKRGR